MSCKVHYCKVECSWKTEKGESFENIIIYQQEVENGDVVSSEEHKACGCTLENQTESECSILISSRSPQYNFDVSAVDLLCTARHMEVYSSDDSYLETIRGFMVQEIDDKKIYLLQYSFDKPMKKCKVKLKSLTDVNTLYIHNVFITIVPGTIENPITSSLIGPNIDLDRVKQMMGTTELSENAKHLMQSLECQSKNTQDSPLANIGMMMQMFSQMKTTSMPAQSHQNQTKMDPVRDKDIPKNDAEKNETCQTDEIVQTHAKDKKSDTTQLNDNGSKTQTDIKSELNDTPKSELEKLIVKRLNDMEKRLTIRMEQMILESEKRICDKLEAVIMKTKYEEGLPLD